VSSALEEIATVTAAYRQRADLGLARRLVELRNVAFAEVPKTPGRSTWPAAFADPFPGETGLVTIPCGRLSGDLLGGAITHHGCLRVDGLIDPATAERLRDRIERAFVARDAVRAGGPVDAAAPWFVPYEPGLDRTEIFASDRYLRVVDSPETAIELVDVFNDAGIVRAVSDFFREPPVMIANKWVLRKSVGGVAYGDFHQDGAFLGEGIRTVDCWIALSRCGPGTGLPALEVMPLRVEGILETDARAMYTWTVAAPKVRELLPDVPIARPIFKPGDALFFDELLPHRTSVGRELGTRYAIESWFVAPSSYPDIHLPIVL
jgi:hypothetical protein